MNPEPPSMRLLLLAPALALLTGCVAGTDRFTGPVTGCGADTVGLLDVRGKSFVFTPDQGVMQISGTVTDNHLQGTASEGPANAREPYIIAFDGTRAKATISGKLTRPDCTLDVTLKER